MKGEIWKDIEGYERLYQVSNMGNVKSLERMKWNGRGYQKIPERILKPGKIRGGYLQVQLSKDGKSKPCKVHRLVATAFLDNSDNLPEVNHKDENKKNNCVENLEWCSKLYNINYGTGIKKSAEKRRGKKKSEEHIKKLSKPVFSVNKESGLIMWWQSASEAGRILGIAKQSICACCRGRKCKSAGNHYWFYADDDTE